jgi:hypothetical protein
MHWLPALERRKQNSPDCHFKNIGWLTGKGPNEAVHEKNRENAFGLENQPHDRLITRTDSRHKVYDTARSIKMLCEFDTDEIRLYPPIADEKSQERIAPFIRIQPPGFVQHKETEDGFINERWDPYEEGGLVANVKTARQVVERHHRSRKPQCELRFSRDV